MKTQFRTAYGEHKRVPTNTVGESNTEQGHNHKNALDCGNVVKRFIKTGKGDCLNPHEPLDIASAPDMSFHDMMNVVTEGISAFEKLPANMREAFENDPRKFHDAFGDAEQLDKLVELGLVPKPQEPEKGTEPSKQPTKADSSVSGDKAPTEE